MPQKPAKKIPVRHCVGCGEGKAKKELIRIVRTQSGEISLDATGRKAGRGAYVCPNAACITKAQKRKALERAFTAPVPADVYEQLTQQLAETGADV